VILTAAHCVRDRETGEYNTNFAFALQYHEKGFSHRYGWKCVATPDGWVRPGQQGWYWDYAMLLLTEESDTGHFGSQQGWNNEHGSASKIGYPIDAGGGEIVQVVDGPVSLVEFSGGGITHPNSTGEDPLGLIEMRHGNPTSGKGSSGGAWVARLSNQMDTDANIIVSVTSFGTKPGVVYGPSFTAAFKQLFDYVSQGCP